MLIRIALISGAFLALTGPLWAQEAADAVAPESATSIDAGAFEAISEPVADALRAKAEGRPFEARDWMIAAANPHAVSAGARVLRDGGTAADAMVAVQAVLGLVEPQSSGLGGGAFLVWHDGASGEITTLDGRETAPAAASRDMYLVEGVASDASMRGGLAVATPGLVRGVAVSGSYIFVADGRALLVLSDPAD